MVSCSLIHRTQIRSSCGMKSDMKFNVYERLRGQLYMLSYQEYKSTTFVLEPLLYNMGGVT